MPLLFFLWIDFFCNLAVHPCVHQFIILYLNNLHTFAYKRTFLQYCWVIQTLCVYISSGRVLIIFVSAIRNVNWKCDTVESSYKKQLNLGILIYRSGLKKTSWLLYAFVWKIKKLKSCTTKSQLFVKLKQNIDMLRAIKTQSFSISRYLTRTICRDLTV